MEHHVMICCIMLCYIIYYMYVYTYNSMCVHIYIYIYICIYTYMRDAPGSRPAGPLPGRQQREGVLRRHDAPQRGVFLIAYSTISLSLYIYIYIYM